MWKRILCGGLATLAICQISCKEREREREGCTTVPPYSFFFGKLYSPRSPFLCLFFFLILTWSPILWPPFYLPPLSSPLLRLPFSQLLIYRHELAKKRNAEEKKQKTSDEEKALAVLPPSTATPTSLPASTAPA